MLSNDASFSPFNDSYRSPSTMAAVITATWNSNLKVIESLVEQEQESTKRILNNNAWSLSPSSSGISSPSGFGPLHFAASLGNEQILIHLLESGMCDKNARDKDGNTPLMWVVSSNGSEELMEALVDHGADVNIQNYAGQTALFIAAERGYLEKMEYLLENGALFNMKNLEGATPLHVAVAAGQTEIVMRLIQYGAYLNVGDDEEDTPLHWAVREGNQEMVMKLIEAGADANWANVDGETPTALAASLEEKEMEELLNRVGSVAPILGQQHSPEQQTVKMQMMDVEMKNLKVTETKQGAKEVITAFGTTPPAISFVY